MLLAASAGRVPTLRSASKEGNGAFWTALLTQLVWYRRCCRHLKKAAEPSLRLICKDADEQLNNCFKEGELEKSATVKESLTVQIEGSRRVKRSIARYNLDVIISVGYRVKSKQGTQFRIWATQVLRDYLLKGYALNQRIDRIENNYHDLRQEVKQMALQLKTQELPNQGIFFNGQVFDAYAFVAELVELAFGMLKKWWRATLVLMVLSKQNHELKLKFDKFDKNYPCND